MILLFYRFITYNCQQFYYFIINNNRTRRYDWFQAFFILAKSVQKIPISLPELILIPI